MWGVKERQESRLNFIFEALSERNGKRNVGK